MVPVARNEFPLHMFKFYPSCDTWVIPTSSMKFSAISQTRVTSSSSNSWQSQYSYATHSANNVLLHIFLFSFNLYILSSLVIFKIFQGSAFVLCFGVRDVVGAQEIIVKWMNWLILTHFSLLFFFFFNTSHLTDTFYTVVFCFFPGWFWYHFLFLFLLLS